MPPDKTTAEIANGRLQISAERPLDRQPDAKECRRRGTHLRFRAVDCVDGQPFMGARTELIPELDKVGRDTEAQGLRLKLGALEALELLPETPPQVASAIQQIANPGQLANLVAGFMDHGLDKV